MSARGDGAYHSVRGCSDGAPTVLPVEGVVGHTMVMSVTEKPFCEF